MHIVKAIMFCLILPLPALADTISQDRESTIAQCRTALAADDAGALRHIAITISSWGHIKDPALRASADFCLDLARARLRAGPAKAEAAPAEVEEADTALDTYLERATAEDAELASLAKDIAEDTDFAPGPGSRRDRLEDALLAYVKPLPAAQAEANLIAYRALSRLVPDKETYRAKAGHYTDTVHAIGRRTARRLVKTTAAFDGSSWSRHPNSPRYQDIRDYVTLYILEDENGERDLELFVNYTSRDGWLFVRSAEINIDGQKERLPSRQWSRDNDTEIWEYAGFLGPKMVDLSKRIANSRRAVIRFHGRHGHSDHVISATEKQVIREMLLAFAYLEADRDIDAAN